VLINASVLVIDRLFDSGARQGAEPEPTGRYVTLWQLAACAREYPPVARLSLYIYTEASYFWGAICWDITYLSTASEPVQLLYESMHT